MNQRNLFSNLLRAARGPISRAEAAEVTGRKSRSIRNWEAGISAPDPLIQADVIKKLQDYIESASNPSTASSSVSPLPVIQSSLPSYHATQS
jgi:hypothetical protein